MKHILIYRTHRFGDVLQTIPMIKGLKEKYDPCKIMFVVDNAYQELIKKSQLVDNVYAIPFAQFNAEFGKINLRLEDVTEYFHAEIEELRNIEIDLAINRSYNEASALFINAVKPKQKLGKQYSAEGTFFYDPFTMKFMNEVMTNRTKNTIHLVDFGCKLANVSPEKRELQFIPDCDDNRWWDQQRLEYNFTGNEILIGIQLGANAAYRHWGENNISQVISKFRTISKQLDKDIKFLIFGHINEIVLYQKLTALMDDYEDIINFVGRTSFGQLAAALKQCRILITVDTGTMHLATAVKTSVLSLFFTSAFLQETGPYGLGNYTITPDIDCYPCYHPNKCTINFKCRQLITAQEVNKAIDLIFGIIPAQQLNFNNVNLWYSNPMPITGDITYKLLYW